MPRKLFIDYKVDDGARTEWMAGRYERFSRYQSAWKALQPHTLIPETIVDKSIAGGGGRRGRLDFTEMLSRMTDMVCVCSGVYNCQLAFESHHEYLGERLALKLTYPTVVVEQVRRSFLRALDVAIEDASRDALPDPRACDSTNRCECEDCDGVDEDGYYYRFLPPLPFTLARKRAERGETEQPTAARHTYAMVAHSWYETRFKTTGGPFGVYQRRAIKNAINELDGITPTSEDVWSPPKPGSTPYYPSRSWFRFAMFESLLWFRDKHGRTPERVTMDDVVEYVGLFEARVSGINTLYNLLQHPSLGGWKQVRLELVRCCELTPPGSYDPPVRLKRGEWQWELARINRELDEQWAQRPPVADGLTSAERLARLCRRVAEARQYPRY